MNLPIRHRSGAPWQRGFPWSEPIAAEFGDLFERMNRFLESAALTPALTEAMAWAPPADLHETDEAYRVECELPGIAREDIDVEVGEHEVSISGELRECEREGVLRHRGRPTGQFAYRALLPVDVKSDEVTASLSDGVLTVTIPKAQAAKPRHIEIQG
ncbi:Hsp20/alpha crystallin family protein [Streptomyces sp. RS10V-4]|uniref:Hsp20/alpha crystallin family protein n=1 Tax=Streptomyces rhizoryzae TaxID=2932493 RepID=UPI002005E799|nr:Hsp20/alpha crystallin family protein [Streptomyces rhizoryzae]MCK7622527.1 Hsp20/alpha crystallin family protein [Streptomyces rhizoryzae]